MNMHFFRYGKNLFREARLVFQDEVPEYKQATKIGEAIKKKEQDARASEDAESLKPFEALRDRVKELQKKGMTEVTQMSLFAFKTNDFLKKQKIRVNGALAEIPAELAKPVYLQLLIEAAGFHKDFTKPPEMDQKTTEDLKSLEDDLTSLKLDTKEIRSAFITELLKDPKNASAPLLEYLNFTLKQNGKKEIPKSLTLENVLVVINRAGFIDANELGTALATLKGPDVKKSRNEPDQERPAQEKPAEEKKDDYIEPFQPDQARQPPVQFTPPEPERPAAPREPEMSVESLERDMRALRNAPINSDNWNKAAGIRMQICVMQFDGKRGVSIDEKLAKMGGERLGTNEYKIVDQRKMFYALRDYDVGGSFYEQDLGKSVTQDNIDSSKARETGDQHNLDHFRAMQEVKRRLDLRAGAKSEAFGRKEGNTDTDRLWLEQDPNYKYVMEYQALVKYHDSLRSYKLSANQRKLWDSMGSFLQIHKYTIIRNQISNDDKKDALERIRKVMVTLQSSLGAAEIPQSFEAQEKQMEKRYVQLMLDSPRYDDPRFLNDVFKLGVTKEEVVELRRQFGNLIRTWYSSNVLEKQDMLKKFDGLLADMNRKEQALGGKGMVNDHYEDAPVAGQEAAPRVVKTIPKDPSSYLAQRDTPPPASSSGVIPGDSFVGVGLPDSNIGVPKLAPTEVKTNALKMEQEHDAKFEDLIQTPMFAPDAEEWREVWAEKTQMTNTRERIEEKRTLLKRMEATKSGDLLKEVSFRKDKQTLTLPLNFEDIVVIYPKGEGENSLRRIVHAPFRRDGQGAYGKYEGESGNDVALKHGVWISRASQTDSTGRELLQGITIHFTTNEPYIVEVKSERQTKMTYDMEQQALKIKEAKDVASGKFEWHTLKNGVQGYVYWFDKRTNILYGQTPDGQYPQAFDVKTGVRTYLTPAQMSAIGENAQDPAKEKQKISEAKTQAVDTWNFGLDSALVDKQSGKKFGYFFDSKEGVVYATDPSRSTFFYWDEDKSDWSKILRKDISDDAVAGLEQAKVEVSRNKPKKLGGTGARVEKPKSSPVTLEKSSELPKQAFDVIWKEWEALAKETDAAFTGKVVETQTRRIRIEAEENTLGKFFQNEEFQKPEFADRMAEIQKRVTKLLQRRQTLKM